MSNANTDRWTQDLMQLYNLETMICDTKNKSDKQQPVEKKLYEILKNNKCLDDGERTVMDVAKTDTWIWTKIAPIAPIARNAPRPCRMAAIYRGAKFEYHYSFVVLIVCLDPIVRILTHRNIILECYSSSLPASPSALWLCLYKKEVYHRTDHFGHETLESVFASETIVIPVSPERWIQLQDLLS